MTTGSLSDWLVRLEGRHPKSIDLGLERCRAVFESLGGPRPAPLVVSVAGTNGKGSVVFYLSRLLQTAGLRCGTYTSPHLMVFNERICIEQSPAADEQIMSAFEQTESARGSVSLTYFEFTTLAAFLVLKQANLDAAVLEVGLGGRLDTVNLIDPDCCIITNIGLDHQQYLGPDRESIGREKAGILRPGVVAVCADREPPHSLLRRARELDSPLMLLGRDFEHTCKGENARLRIGKRTYAIPLPRMEGEHQMDNLAAALVAAEEMKPGILADYETLNAAVAESRLAGRLYSFPGDQRFVLDVGHNPHAAAAVAKYFAGIPGFRGKLICVLAMLEDKDVGEVARLLDPVVGLWLCAGITGPRGQSGKALAKRVRNSLHDASIEVCESVGEATRHAHSLAGGNDRVLVFGSFETVAAATRELGELLRVHCC